MITAQRIMIDRVQTHCSLQVPTVAIEHVFFLNNTSIIAVRCLREHIVPRKNGAEVGQPDELTL